MAIKSYYAYQPSEPAAAVACAVFGIGALISFYQTIRYKAWIWLVMVLAVSSK
jgi:hypothetical protein